MKKGRRGREDEKETKKQLALGFQVRKELALFVHVNFFFPWPVVWKALAGIARHGLPNSACAREQWHACAQSLDAGGVEEWSGPGVAGRGGLITTNCHRAPGTKVRFWREEAGRQRPQTLVVSDLRKRSFPLEFVLAISCCQSPDFPPLPALQTHCQNPGISKRPPGQKQ